MEWMVTIIRNRVLLSAFTKKNVRQNVFSWNTCKSKLEKEKKILEAMKIFKSETEENVLNENQNLLYESVNNNEEENNLTLGTETFNDINVQNNVVNDYEFNDFELNDNNNHDCLSEYESNGSSLDDSDNSECTEENSYGQKQNCDHNNNNVDDDNVIIEEQHEINDVHNGTYNVPNEVVVDVLNNSNISNNQFEIGNNSNQINEVQNNNEPINTQNTNNNKELSNIQLLSEVFCHHNNIIVIKQSQLWNDEIAGKNVNVIIFGNVDCRPNNESNTDMNVNNLYYDIIPRDIVLDRNWEIRFMYVTTNVSENHLNKWKSNIYVKHANSICSNWWRMTSESESVKKMDKEFNILNIDMNAETRCHVAVFVRLGET